jgi:Ca-activated chloride channel homolog
MEDEFDPEAPYFEVLKGDSLPLKNTKIKAKLSGIMGQITIVQTYRNEGKVPIEAAYVFPGSTRAAVHEATLTIGDEVIKARIKTTAEAQHIYDQAVSSGKTASLLTQERPNVFQQKVGNIMPGDNIEVTIVYSEEIPFENGEYKFILPAVVGPRYTGEATIPSIFEKMTYVQGENKIKSPVEIEIELVGGTNISGVRSLSHKPVINKKDSAVQVKYKTDNFNKDFILSYSLQSDDISSGLLIHRGEEENFFVVSVEPPKELTTDIILPREYQFIVDVSGSMSGFPLDTTKELLEKLLPTLSINDSFNIRFFAGDSWTLSPTAIPASPENVAMALNSIKAINSGGGTNLLEALKSSFAELANTTQVRSIIIITDGFIDVEKEAFSLIRSNLNRANLFSFGIGASVNRYLVEGLAHLGHGTPFFVAKPEEASSVTNEFVKLIKSPVLHDLKLQFDGFEAFAVEPRSIPAVFKDRPLYVYGKWKGELGGAVTVSGSSSNGQFKKVISLNQNSEQYNPALRYLWARKRLQMLEDYQNGFSIEQKEKITQLALRYSLLSPYTSFVAVSEHIRNSTYHTLEKIQQPNQLPAGVTFAANTTGQQAIEVPSYEPVDFSSYNDWRIAQSNDVVLTYLSGAFGALFMVVCALIGIVFLAFATKTSSRRRNLTIAAVFFILALACFLLRSVISHYFNFAMLN